MVWRSFDLSPVITQRNYNTEQKGTLQLLIKMLETDTLSMGLGSLKSSSLGLGGKSLQSHVGAAEGVHRGFEGLGKCQGACGRARGLWTRTEAATHPTAVGRDLKTVVRDWTGGKVHSRA